MLTVPVITVFTIAFMSMLASSTVFGREDLPNGIGLLVIGAFSLFAAAMGIVDYTGRLAADQLKTSYLPKSATSESKLYFGPVFATFEEGLHCGGDRLGDRQRGLVIADVSERGVVRLQALHPGTVARPPPLSPRHPLGPTADRAQERRTFSRKRGRSTCWPTFGSCTVLRRTRLRREQARVVAEVVELGLLGCSARGSEIIG